MQVYLTLNQRNGAVCLTAPSYFISCFYSYLTISFFNLFMILFSSREI